MMTTRQQKQRHDHPTSLHALEGILDQILGHVLVPSEIARERVGRIQVGQHELAKALLSVSSCYPIR